MEKVYVMDNRGREKVAKKVAYFKVLDKKYFIYTLEEIDNEGYIKLYIKQFENGEDIEIPGAEWDYVKGLVQEVLRQMRDGEAKTYENLNSNDVTEVMESGSRVFKIKQDIIRQIKEQNLKKDDYDFQDVNELSNALIEAFKKATLENEKKEPEILMTEEKEVPVIDKDEETKIKPFVVSNVPILEYQETILRLEQDAKKVQELCRNLKNENDRLILENDNLKKSKRILESENERLRKQMEQYKSSIDHYQGTLEHLKDIMKGLE